ncbi:MAG: rRNA pseudouridine synthase [Pelagimonas sp.]|jgi:23S rRNA pseudouridine2605 synthase|nr:rRNA pseudouridine synthase [Pelagimonas sp.]
MTQPKPPAPSKDQPQDQPQAQPKTGDRIAKVIARAGVASRRDAERMIEEGRVQVNGKVIERAALNVTPRDRIEVDGKLLDPPEEPRLWLYHKPVGLVTTNRDEQGRKTIFDDLPEDLPRVMSVGRLDLNSEGLLLLTNDGDLKRRLELPSTGWLRKYRVRVNGRPTDQMLEPLRKGITVDGQSFQPMIINLDRQQGANAWLTIGLREGKNREIRRAMAEIGLTVNRLIRLSYGPFQLGQLKSGEVEEIRRRALRDQLGLAIETPAPKPKGDPKGVNRRRKPAKPGAGKPGGGKTFGAKRPGATRTPERGPGQGAKRGPTKGKGRRPGPKT